MLIGLMLARNEEWVIGLSVRVALRWCDAVVVLDHASTDRTPRILDEIEAEYPGRLTRLRQDDPVWYEMQYRQHMLVVGRQIGGTHFAIIDADEVLTNNLLFSIRSATGGLAPASVLETWMPCCWRSINLYRADRSVWSRVWLSLAFQDHSSLHWVSRQGYDFHHRHPHGSTFTNARPFGHTGGVMHLQFVNRRRLVAKQVLYKMLERVRWPERETAESVDRKYDQAINDTGATFAPVDPLWWAGYEDLMQYADFSDHPVWQEQECRRLMAAYGPSRFVGLNLYGVA